MRSMVGYDHSIRSFSFSSNIIAISPSKLTYQPIRNINFRVWKALKDVWHQLKLLMMSVQLLLVSEETMLRKCERRPLFMRMSLWLLGR